MDDLLDILSRMGGHAVPDGEAIKDTIIQTAHKQLIQEPMYALKMMAASAQCTLKSLLPTMSAVLALYESKIPTAKGIIALFKPNEKQPSHSKTMQFLKLFDHLTKINCINFCALPLGLMLFVFHTLMLSLQMSEVYKGVQWHIHVVHCCRYPALTVPTLNFEESLGVS